jgi:hypothetical protein
MIPSLVVLVSVLGAAPADAPPLAYRPQTAPAELRPAVDQAQAAVQALQKRLQARLGKAMADGGPGRAVAVCRDDAPRLAAEAASETGLRLGRTSDRLRNPSNVAPAWASPHVQAAAGKKAAEVEPAIVDLGGAVGVLFPIAVAPACLHCHGPAASLAPEVQRELKAAYPADRATGYAARDLRGFLWAEVKK